MTSDGAMDPHENKRNTSKDNYIDNYLKMV